MFAARRRPFRFPLKRATYRRRRSYAGGYKRRRYAYASVKRRAFTGMNRYMGRMAPRSYLNLRPQLSLERERMVHRVHYHYRYTPGSTTGVDPATGVSDVLYFKLNDIYTPGVLGPTTGMPVAEGHTSQSNKYTSWQVRGARIYVRLQEGGTSAQTPSSQDWRWVMVPLSSSNYTVLSGATATTAFNRFLEMPGRSKLAHSSYAGSAVGESGLHHLMCASSPARVQGDPLYYSKASSIGVGTTPPTDTPCFALIGSRANNLESLLFFEMDITIEYSVVWFGRVITPLTQITEPARPDEKVGVTGLYADEDEEDRAFLDLGDVEESLEDEEESKEEKKEAKHATREKVTPPKPTHTPPSAAVAAAATPPPPTPAKKSLFKARATPPPPMLVRTVSGPITLS